MSDLDTAMDVLDSLEKKSNKIIENNEMPKVTIIGVVEQFFNKINVVAIKLNSELKIGDIIEIGTEESAVRQKVLSMQINREDVDIAYSGDSVGIKIKYRVDEGSNVYKIEK